MTMNQDFTQSSGVNNGSKDSVFYNTIHLEGDDLVKAKKQAGSQETKIVDLLKTNSRYNFTKHEIYKSLVLQGRIKQNTPESSISRALTNLMKDGYIVKLSGMRMGGFDKPNHLWQIKTEPRLEVIQTNLFEPCQQTS
jgi:hypothetical protein